MSRDWITIGRRPSGLCGAAILISARYHGFNRSINQIISVVNVCDETIKIRLREFSMTEIANLTKEEFESFDLNINGSVCGNLPPSFRLNRIKEKLHKIGLKNPMSIEYKEKAKEIQDLIEKDNINKQKNKKILKRGKFAKIKIIQKDEKEKNSKEDSLNDNNIANNNYNENNNDNDNDNEDEDNEYDNDEEYNEKDLNLNENFNNKINKGNNLFNFNQQNQDNGKYKKYKYKYK
jgi:transcription factor IIIB subunit 2